MDLLIICKVLALFKTYFDKVQWQPYRIIYDWYTFRKLFFRTEFRLENINGSEGYERELLN